MTLITQGFTAALAFTAITEVILMNDPQIISFSKPLSSSDKEELIPVSFKEYDYVLAFKIEQPLPIEIGRILAKSSG